MYLFDYLFKLKVLIVLHKSYISFSKKYWTFWSKVLDVFDKSYIRF